MPLSKTLPKSVANERVLDYAPKPITRDISKAAEEFIETRRKNITAFKLSDLVANQSGIAEKERTALEQKAETIALEKIREIQEPAYQQAYDLGIEEGRKSAYDGVAEEIKERLDKLDELLTAVTKIKSDMVQQCEGQIVKAVYHLATRLARFEIQGHDDRIIGVLKQAVEHAQSLEAVTVKLSKEDFEFLQTLKDHTKRDLEFMKKVKLQPVQEIQPGGCVLETNFGVIDATVEERINSLWGAIEPKIVKPKEKLEG